MTSRMKQDTILVAPSDDTFTNFSVYITFLGLEHIFAIVNVELGHGANEADVISRNWRDLPLRTTTKTSVVLSEALRTALGHEDPTVSDDHSTKLQKVLSQSLTMRDCANEIMSYMKRVERDSNDLGMMPPAGYYKTIIDEINATGWSHLIGVNDSLSRLQMQVQDQKRRNHLVTVVIKVLREGLQNADEPTELMLHPVVELDVPTSESTDGVMGAVILGENAMGAITTRSIRELLIEAGKELSNYQLFWDVMDDFDSHVWVLEPQHPSRSSRVRRIAVQEHCTMHIKISHTDPMSQCEVEFMGQDKVVEPLRTKLHARLDSWDIKRYPRDNLQRLLEITFPHPQTSSKDDFKVECGICYSYKLGDGTSASSTIHPNTGVSQKAMLPDFICNTCGQAFHHACVSEWLQSIPSTRRSFNMLFGSCPYCSAPVSVPATVAAVA